MSRLVKISELFNIRYGNSLELIHLIQSKSSDKSSVPFVSRTEKNNGVSAYVEKEPGIETNPAHSLSVAVGGSVLSTFYQSFPFYTGFHVLVLTPKKETSETEMLFYAKCINANKYKYNYGRQANKTLKKIFIPDSMPKRLSYHLFAYYKKALTCISKESLIDRKIGLNIENWKYFFIGELFYLKKAKPVHALLLEDVENGNLPYITRTNSNNGVERFITDNNRFDENFNQENCISVGGESLSSFYQFERFIAGNNITLLYNKDLNKYNALFFNTILTKDLQKKFNYGRGATKTRLGKLKIKLPSKNNLPDWEYMEKYIKSLPYSKFI
ncbi:MAG: restriction endonuclease subunit S [Deltaproteobacteria bacterium]|nr:restriction endonuclease subunit S [Deltaproteobacteria bacterium]